MAVVRADRRTGGGHCPAARLGLAALALMAIGVASPQAQRVPDRTLAFYNIHTKETVTATFKRGGRYLPDGLKQVNWALRDWRRDEPTTMDPKLIDLLWEIHADVGSRAPIHVISGYRSPATNAMWNRKRALRLARPHTRQPPTGDPDPEIAATRKRQALPLGRPTDSRPTMAVAHARDRLDHLHQDQ